MVIARRKPAPKAPVAPEKISVGVSNKRPSTSRFPKAAFVKKTPVPVAPKNKTGSGISKHHRASNNNSSWKKSDVVCNVGTEPLSRKESLAKGAKDGRGMCSD